MPAADAKPIPIRNQAYRVTFGIFDNTGALIPGATGLDSERSLDGATFADCTNEATEIPTSSGVYFLDLTAAEMDADTVTVLVKSSSPNAVPVVIPIYPQEAGDIRVSVQTAIRKNQALLNYPVLMTDSTNHNPITGLTLTGSRSIDGAAPGALSAPNFTENGNGLYPFDLSASDMNGDTIVVRLTAPGADDLAITFVPLP